MKEFFNPLFRSSRLRFTYNLPMDIARERMEKVFDRSGLLEGPDLIGSFTGAETFRIKVSSPGYTMGVSYGSTLYGTMRHLKENTTEVLLEILPANSFKFLFFIWILAGFYIIINAILGNANFTIWPGLGFLIIGPILTVKVADVNNGIVEDRYRRYIHRGFIAKTDQ